MFRKVVGKKDVKHGNISLPYSETNVVKFVSAGKFAGWMQPTPRYRFVPNDFQFLFLL
jgi:hypothetical protein